MKRFFVFGTHPRLSLAECRAVLPVSTPTPLTVGQAAVLDDIPEWNGTALMAHLGGTVKLGDVVRTCDMEDATPEALAEICAERPRGNDISFGCAVIGGTPGVRRALERLPLHLKRALKARGIRSRWVTSKDSPAPSPAAVAKLRLTTQGYDLVLIADGAQVHIGLTTHVQNADAWSVRDYGRPARDDEAGMLPPKLARMMVNLAQVHDGMTVLDPFCGSGTVLMEAALATRADRIVGSDIEGAQISAAKKNHGWLIAERILAADDAQRVILFSSDVRNMATHVKKGSVDRVVTEGYLGPPLKGSEPLKHIERTRDDIERLWKDALSALHPVLTKQARLVIVWPSFKTSHGLARVKLDDAVSEFGYRVVNPLEGWDETNAPLVYHREGQKVARRIVVLEKS